MDEIFSTGETNDEISIERCRELLGEEAIDLCDDAVDRIRHCADTFAQVVIEMFLDEKRRTIHQRMRTNLRALHAGSMLTDMVGAVIYVRVSTKEQTVNLSLPTQLKACEEYCQRQGFHVLARFREEGESAKTADRTALQKLLQSTGRTAAPPSLSSFAYRRWRFANVTPEPDFR